MEEQRGTTMSLIELRDKINAIIEKDVFFVWKCDVGELYLQM